MIFIIFKFQVVEIILLCVAMVPSIERVSMSLKLFPCPQINRYKFRYIKRQLDRNEVRQIDRNIIGKIDRNVKYIDRQTYLQRINIRYVVLHCRQMIYKTIDR